MRRYRYLLLLFLFLPQFLYAQGLPFYNPGGAVISGAGRPIAGATITVCIGSTVPPLGTLCTATLSKASLYSNYALTLPIANPQATDGYGNIGPSMQRRACMSSLLPGQRLPQLHSHTGML